MQEAQVPLEERENPISAPCPLAPFLPEAIKSPEGSVLLCFYDEVMLSGAIIKWMVKIFKQK